MKRVICVVVCLLLAFIVQASGDYQQYRSLQSAYLNPKAVKDLYIYHLQAVDSSIALLENLEVLEFAPAYQQSYPDGVTNKTVFQLPTEIFKLEQLSVLRLGRNQMFPEHAFPSAALPSLEELEVSHVPSWIGELSVSKLSIATSDAPVGALPRTLKSYCLTLRGADAAKIEQHLTQISRLTSLETLKLNIILDDTTKLINSDAFSALSVLAELKSLDLKISGASAAFFDDLQWPNFPRLESLTLELPLGNVDEVINSMKSDNLTRLCMKPIVGFKVSAEKNGSINSVLRAVEKNYPSITNFSFNFGRFDKLSSYLCVTEWLSSQKQITEVGLNYILYHDGVDFSDQDVDAFWRNVANIKQLKKLSMHHLKADLATRNDKMYSTIAGLQLIELDLSGVTNDILSVSGQKFKFPSIQAYFNVTPGYGQDFYELPSRSITAFPALKSCSFYPGTAFFETGDTLKLTAMQGAVEYHYEKTKLERFRVNNPDIKYTEPRIIGQLLPWGGEPKTGEAVLCGMPEANVVVSRRNLKTKFFEWEYYKNGMAKSMVCFDHSIADGVDPLPSLWLQWDEDGKLLSRCEFGTVSGDGKQYAKQFVWFSNGQLERIWEFSVDVGKWRKLKTKGTLHGRLLTLTSDGGLVDEGVYVEGKKIAED